MLVGLNRQNHRDLSVTATDLPLNPSTVPGASPAVAVFGRLGRVAGLPAHLPAGWSLRQPADLDDVHPGDLVLFADATEHEVRTARASLPRRTRIVAMVDDTAPAELVTAVLTAGADACVRGGQPATLASHLIACRRRQLAERWAGPQTAARLL